MIDSTNPRVMADNIRHLKAGEQINASDISDNATEIAKLESYPTDSPVIVGKVGTKTLYRQILTGTTPTGDVANIGIDLNYTGIFKIGGTVMLSSTNCGDFNRYVSWDISTVGSNKLNIYKPGNTSAQGRAFTIDVYFFNEPSSLTSPTPDDSRSIEPEVIEDPEIRSEEIEPEVNEEIPEEEPVVETKTTRKRSTSTK